MVGSPQVTCTVAVTCDSELAELCREILGTWGRILREGLGHAGIAGKRAAGLATLVVSALEGALILARSEQSTRPLAVIADELVPLIAGLAEPRASRGTAAPIRATRSAQIKNGQQRLETVSPGKSVGGSQ